jgi:excisionase family DNA binding protein
MGVTASSAPDITVPQAAERKGVSAKTIRRWIADGTLPAYRVGQKLIRIRVADLDALGTPLGPGAR